jgi:hypothetical protein
LFNDVIVVNASFYQAFFAPEQGQETVADFHVETSESHTLELLVASTPSKNATIQQPARRKASTSLVRQLDKYLKKRAHLRITAIDYDFIVDTRLAMDQMSLNYDGNSSCHRTPVRKAVKKCYGLGGTISNFNRVLLRRFKMHQTLNRVDLYRCFWFINDKTKPCDTLFDCYLPSLSNRYPNRNGTCLDLTWFIKRHGDSAFHAVIALWMFGKEEFLDTPPEPCIALHIRRGDACIMADRKCFPYEDYFKAVKLLVDRHVFLNRLVVLTDADDFPLAKFQSLIPNVTYTQSYNRTRYNVNHLRQASYEVTAPEYRNMENATSEFFSEIEQGWQCSALVGTFSAAVSKILFNLMLARQGRMPLHYSLDGCGRNIWHGSSDSDEGCAPNVLQ